MTDDRERSDLRAQRDAVGSTIGHEGPTAERYESVLVRYLSAVAGAEVAAEAGVQHDEPAFAAAFAPWLVGDVMTREAVSAHQDAVFKEVAIALDRNRISAVPVIDEERKVIGVVTVSDLLTRIAGPTGTGPRGHRFTSRAVEHRKRDGLTARELMTSPAITTTSATPVADAARLAARARVRTLPVVNGSGVLIGVVTRGDLLKVFLRSDEDIRRDVERDVLAATLETSHGTVQVGVSEGVVTLSGTVPTARDARRLVHATHRVTGVIDVHDKLGYETGDSFMALNQPR